MTSATYRLESNGPRWRIVVTDYDGKRFVKGVGTKAELKTRAKAERAAAQVFLDLVENSRGKLKIPVVTLQDLEQRWLMEQDDPGGPTARLYRQAFGHLYGYLGAGFKIQGLTRDRAALFRGYLAQQDIATSTIAKHIRHCKSAFQFALHRDLVRFNPFDGVSGVAPKLADDWHYLELDDLEKILSECPSDGWRVLWGLGRLAGLRLGESRRLRWRDIDFAGKVLTVWPPNGEETTKKRKRVVPISPRLFRLLADAQLSAPDGVDNVLHGVHAPGSKFYNRVKKIVLDAGLTPWAKPMHTLRKNLATDWYEQHPPMDVAKWLGHSPAVAMKHYHQTKKTAIEGVTDEQRSTEPAQPGEHAARQAEPGRVQQGHGPAPLD